MIIFWNTVIFYFYFFICASQWLANWLLVAIRTFSLYFVYRDWWVSQQQCMSGHKRQIPLNSRKWPCLKKWPENQNYPTNFDDPGVINFSRRYCIRWSQNIQHRTNIWIAKKWKCAVPLFMGHPVYAWPLRDSFTWKCDHGIRLQQFLFPSLLDWLALFFWNEKDL